MWYKVLEKNMFILNLYTEIPELTNVRIAKINITVKIDDKILIKNGWNVPLKNGTLFPKGESYDTDRGDVYDKGYEE